MMTDPISDLLTRIRNAISAEREIVEIPYSKMKLELVKVLEREGYIRSHTVAQDGSVGKVLVTLKYTPKKKAVISYLQRVSKPGRRVYRGYQKIKPVLGGMGISVLSTSQGLMTDKQAKEAKIGGEWLCSIW